MVSDLENSINRAKDLLKTVRHAAMATVNEDDSPHNTPYRFMSDPELKYIYWSSVMDSLHSVNILRNGKLFVVLYEANVKGGLYIKAEGGHVLSGTELQEALSVHNELRKAEGKEALSVDYYTGPNAPKMWSAKISKLWVNSATKDANGNILKDGRIEISSKDLLG